MRAGQHSRYGRTPIRNARATPSVLSGFDANRVVPSRPSGKQTTEGAIMIRLKVASVLTCAAVLMPLALATPAGATYPARNGLIAFQAETGGVNQIYTVSRNGHSLRQVTHVAPQPGSIPGRAAPRRRTGHRTGGGSRSAATSAPSRSSI